MDVVVLAPTTDHAVRRRQHDVPDPFVRRDSLTESRARQPDARPQLEDINGTEPLPQHMNDAASREQAGRGHPKDGGLPRSVRAEDDPALVLIDLPIDVVEQCGTVADHPDTLHAHDVTEA